MKKRMLIVTAVIMCITSGKAFAEMNTPVYDVFTQQMTVSGKTISGKSNRPISVNVLNPEENSERTLQYADSALTGPDGEYEFVFKVHFDDSSKGGEFKALAGGYDFDIAEEKTIYIAGTEEIKEILNSINTKSRKELAPLIKEYMNKLNINFELCGKVDADTLAYIVKNEAEKKAFDADKLDETYSRLKGAAVIAAYNDGNQELVYSGADMIYADILGLDKLDENGTTLYSIYNSLITEDGKKVLNNALLKRNFKDIQALTKEFSEQVMLKAIQYPNVGGVEYVSNVITTANAKATGLSAAKYLSSSNKSAVNAKVARKSYASIAALEQAISSGGNSVSGGGSSGNSGSNRTSTAPGMVAISETNRDNISLSMFNDIPENYWLYKELYEMKEMEIISGDADNNFNPDNPIKREEFAKIVCNAFNLKMQDTNVEFTDVDSGAWYENYVKIAAANGIVNGYEDGSFGVGQNITRQDICVMVFRALKTENEDPNQAVFKFKDKDEISEYAEPAINYMYVKKVITGFEDYTFRPKEECTRAHAVKILHQMLGRAKGITEEASEK